MVATRFPARSIAVLVINQPIHPSSCPPFQGSQSTGCNFPAASLPHDPRERFSLFLGEGKGPETFPRSLLGKVVRYFEINSNQHVVASTRCCTFPCGRTHGRRVIPSGSVLIKRTPLASWNLEHQEIVDDHHRDPGAIGRRRQRTCFRFIAVSRDRPRAGGCAVCRVGLRPLWGND